MSLNIQPVKFDEPESKIELFLDKHHWLREVLWFFEDIWDKITFGKFRRRFKFAFEYGKFAYKNQFDFDYIYIFSLLKFKLERTRESMRAHTYDSDATRALDLCIKLCDRLDKDQYGQKYGEAFDKKWGECKVTYPRKTRDNGREYTTMEFVYPDMSKEAQMRRREETRSTMEMEQKMRERDMRLLGNLMAKYVWLWWD